MQKNGIKNINILSEKSGVPYMTIKNFYVKGAENIKLSTLNKLKNYFGCTLDYLVSDEVSEPGGYAGKSPAINGIYGLASRDEINLLANYQKLNADGREEANKQVENLTYIAKYTAAKGYQKNTPHRPDEPAGREQEENEKIVPIERKPQRLPDHLRPVAAHMNPDAVPEEIQHDNNLMDNDELWGE